MASAKEIRTKIKSIQNTKKVTKALEMVSASKVRKAQDRMQATRPYAERIREVIGHLAKSHPEHRHRYWVDRPVKRVGLIVVSTDRGLCGGLNINLFKQVLNKMREWRDANLPVDVALLGTKAEAFFRRIGSNVVAHTGHLGDKPAVVDLIGAIKIMLDAYNQGQVDVVYFAYNRFVNTMTQTPVIEQLLPLPPVEDDRLAYYWDYIYEPDARFLVESLVERYIESQVYQGVVENIASEQAARMVAMKAASDNAAELINQFQLVYNKARQAAITQELSEIVAGAAAV